jgi:hypothetical protein
MKRIYNHIMRLRLFSSIVWRVWDEDPEDGVYRISIRTAWSVSHGVWMEE